MSEKEELLPCPFCGGKAEIRKVGQHPYDYIPTCTKGGCYADISCRDTYEEAVTAWNTRPQPDNPDNEAEGVLALFDTCRDSRETNGWANYSFLPEHIESIRRALNQFAERRNMVPDLEEIKRECLGLKYENRFGFPVPNHEKEAIEWVIDRLASH